MAGLSARAVIGTLLYGTPTLDPVTFGGVAVLFAVVAMAATAVPARRAARVEPNAALRAE
jgi:ABC-type lipoprotein release transport system permease subunit